MADPKTTADLDLAITRGAEVRELRKRVSDLEQTLRHILLWRNAVNGAPKEIMKGLENDPEGIAIALFNGPMWQAAAKLMNSNV